MVFPSIYKSSNVVPNELVFKALRVKAAETERSLSDLVYTAIRQSLKDRRKVITKIEALASKPRPRGCEKLSGQEHSRVRQGDYRVVYGIDDTAQTVLVVKIGHRRDAYR